MIGLLGSLLLYIMSLNSTKMFSVLVFSNNKTLNWIFAALAQKSAKEVPSGEESKGLIAIDLANGLSFWESPYLRLKHTLDPPSNSSLTVRVD